MDPTKLNDLRYEYELLFALFNEPITPKQRHRVWSRLKEVLAESKRMLSGEVAALEGAEARLSSLKVPSVRDRRTKNKTSRVPNSL